MIETRAVWDTAYVNSLPDSSFLLVLPGGRKDSEGKTVPRSLRYFPVKNAAGDVDLAHLRNALAQIDKANISLAQKQTARDKAEALAKNTTVGGPKGEYTPSSGRSRRDIEYGGIETRTFAVILEVRDDGDHRTLLGRAVPYGETINIPNRDDRERFAFGAFTPQVQAAAQWARIKLYDSHQARMQGQQPIGKTALLEDRQDGLHGAWPLYNTTRANDALELVRTGEVTGLSIGFKANKPRVGDDGAYERTEAHLDHIVLTHEPAYPGAVVTGIRSLEAHPIAAYKTFSARAHQVIERIRL